MMQETMIQFVSKFLKKFRETTTLLADVMISYIIYQSTEKVGKFVWESLIWRGKYKSQY